MGSQSWFVVMLLVFAAWLPAALAADDVHEGKVIGVTASSITLLDDKDNQFDKFEVNAETKVTRNGKPARLSDVQAGDRCRVTASLSDKRLLAKSIEATAPQ